MIVNPKINILKKIDNIISPTKLENTYRKKCKNYNIIQSPKKEYIRQAGIWFSNYKNDMHNNFYCITDTYDYLIYLKNANYITT